MSLRTDRSHANPMLFALGDNVWFKGDTAQIDTDDAYVAAKVTDLNSDQAIVVDKANQYYSIVRTHCSAAGNGFSHSHSAFWSLRTT